MIQQHNSTSKLITPALVTRMLFGGGVALLAISALLLSADNPPAEWGKYWMVRPLIITPLAGAGGGLFFHLVQQYLNRGGWRTVMAYMIGILGYIIALWLGTVLGCAGTLWN